MKRYKIFFCGLVMLLIHRNVTAQQLNQKPAKPNILIIITDQQNASMMSAAGNKWLKTPAMDALASDGIRFTRAYVTNPVCAPSRFSFMTGHYPTAINMRENTVHGINKPKTDSLYTLALGQLFRNAGYETLYGGKAHLPTLAYTDIEPLGFKRFTVDERDTLAEECVNIFTKRQASDKPFLLVASFINPHDICGNAIQYAGLKPDINFIKDVVKEELKKAKQFPEGISEKEFYDKYCPPLPANHQPMIGETSEVDAFLKLRPFQTMVREEWTEKDWRLHRWAYMRLTERVDAQIGKVMDGLKKSGLAENTIVVFTSDHGEHAGAHKLEHKTLFYEESANIPFIVVDPAMSKKGVVDQKHLVNNGLDLLPTLCDFAGIEPPSGLVGRSLLPLIRQEKKVKWRKHTIIENQIGFLIHTGRYKYELDDKGETREMFVDLKADPGETRNLIHEPKYRKIINKLRGELMAYLDSNGIAMESPLN